MWIPRDERRLLVGYYCSIHAVGSEKEYGTGEFAEFLRCQTNSEVLERDIEQAAAVLARSRKANKVLSARGLIICTPIQPGTSVKVGLTIKGYDLGRRYSNWFSWSGLWFYEYRNHWIWLIAGSFGGAVLTKLVEWTWSFLSNT